MPVRAGDALDAAALTVWLHANAPALLGDSTAPLSIRQFGGGFSNLTYAVSIGERTVVLRRPPRGVARGVAHDMQREFLLLSALHPTTVPVPEPLAFCDDDRVLGAPFYLMEHVPGIILRNAPPADVAFSPEIASRLADAFVQQLAALHALDVSALGVQELQRPTGYVQRQIAGWSRRWEASRTSAVPTLDAVSMWLEANQPPDAGASLIHNDFKYDNLVLDTAELTHIRAILDWEMATVGCPLMDLGTSLAYWVESSDPPLLRALGLGITTAAGTPGRVELAARYAAVSGRALPDLVFYYVFGVFKLAVVAQQIFARHARGLTSDPRFARLDEAVRVLAELATSAIARGAISGNTSA
jgi:aminoglycoside phosphotransferase (APT) family kinase protein